MSWVPKSRLARGLGLVALLLLLGIGGVAVWQVAKPRRPAWVEFLESKSPPVLPAPPSNAATAHGERYSVTYDVRDLVDFGARPVTAAYRCKKAGPRDIDELVGLIVQVVTGPWSGDRTGSTIDEINGTHLEIHTSRKYHAEIGDLLESLRRLDDLAVMVDSQLYEVDRTFYDQVVEPELREVPMVQGRRCGACVSGALAQQIASGGTKTRHGTALVVPNGETARLVSMRRALVGTAYVPGKTGAAAFTPFAESASKNIAFAGVTVKATLVVTADRRYVRLGLEQEIAEQAPAQRHAMVDPNENSVIVETPNVVQSSVKESIQVPDGGTAILPVHQPGKAGNRVLLLVIQPTLYIEAEEKAIHDQDRPLTNPLDWLKKLTTP